MADGLDVITVDNARGAALGTGSSSTNHDITLQRMVTALSRRMDRLIGPVVQRSITEYHDGGVPKVFPHFTPVASVTSVTERRGYGVPTELSADSFGTPNVDGYWWHQSTTDPHGSFIERRSSGCTRPFPPGVDAVQLVYAAGRAVDTSQVDARHAEAACEIVRRMFNRESGAWARGVDPFSTDETGGSPRLFNAIDYVIKELLADELRLPGSA